MTRWILVSAGVVALALLAGCGGGSSSADFVADGNQICKEDNAKFRAVAPPESSDLRPYLDDLVPLLDEDLSRLKGLTPPSDKASVYDAWISLLEQGTALTKQAQEAPSADAATEILQGAPHINEQAYAKAKELGLDKCLSGSGGGSSG